MSARIAVMVFSAVWMCSSASAQPPNDCPPVVGDFCSEEDGLADYLAAIEACCNHDNPGASADDCELTATQAALAVRTFRNACNEFDSICPEYEAVLDILYPNDDCLKNEFLRQAGCAPVFDCREGPGNGTDWPPRFPYDPRDNIFDAEVDDNPFGTPWDQPTKLGGIDLSTGAYEPTVVDLKLPSPGFTWVIGRSHSAYHLDTNGAFYDVDTYQGTNWLQVSQLSLEYTAYTYKPDEMAIRLQGDITITLVESDVDSDAFVALGNGSGVAIYETGSPDIITFYDQHGRQYEFFGPNTTEADAAFQLWRIVDPAGNTAWIGHPTTASIADDTGKGYDADGRLVMAVDPGDRRYTYDYSTSTIGGLKRLESVTVEKKASGTWEGSPVDVSEVARVEYGYYTIDETDEGLEGDLKTVTVVMPTSESDEVERTTLYWYYTNSLYNATTNPGHPHQLRYIWGPEGVRAFEASDGNPTNESHLTGSESQMKSYAQAYFEYEDDTANDEFRQVLVSYFDGACGCAGGSGDGLYEFSYEFGSLGNGVLDDPDEWGRRTVVTQPDGTYVWHYFDLQPLPLATVISDDKPSGSPSEYWITHIVRDATGNATETRTPAAMDNTEFDTNDLFRTKSTNPGLIEVYEYLYDDDFVGFVEHVKWKVGDSGSKYLTTSTEYLAVKLDVEASGVTLRRPFVDASWAYDQETTDDAITASPTGAVKTDFGFTFYEDTDDTDVDFILPEVRDTTLPAVSTSKNGSGTSNVYSVHVRKDGRVDFTKSPDGIIGFTGYDDVTGLPSVRARDVDTAQTTPFGGVSIPTGFSSSGTELHLYDEFTYDDQGRLADTTMFAQAASANDRHVRRLHYTMLDDGQDVILSIPRVKGSDFHGPVGYTVRNHAGAQEAVGTIAIAGGTTTAAVSAWINEAEDDPIAAVDHVDLTLARLTTNVLNEPGTRVEEARVYFDIPSTWPGNSTSNYDETKLVYDEMGRVLATEDATGTINRTVYDGLGRPIETWIGTDDTGFPGTGNMVKTMAYEYDGGNDGGNALLTLQSLDPDGDDRETAFAYDERGRVLLQTNSEEPKYILNKYDNRGRQVAFALFKHDAGGAEGVVDDSDDPATRAEDRLTLSQMFYDELGRTWKSQTHKIDIADGSDDDNLQTLTWYDAKSQIIKVDGSQLTKRSYDRIGRVTHSFLLAADNDSTTYANVLNVSGDIVLEESQAVYDSDTGYMLLSARIDREHDDFGLGETTGALDSNADGEELEYATANLAGRIQITASWHDDIGRVTTMGSYGTNGGSNYAYSTTSPGSSSSSVLVSKATYNDDGSIISLTDRAGTITRYEYDGAGRMIAVISNYDDGTPGGPNGDEDQTIKYEYTDGLMTAMTADLPSDDQETTYTFGVTTSDSPGPSGFNANNVLRKVVYPDIEDGEGEADHRMLFAYNTIGEPVWMQDQLGVVIETDVDGFGRETARRVTSDLTGTGLDTAVKRIETTYDVAGRVDTVTQYSAATSGTVVDQVQYTYDGWNNITKFEQDHDSTVTTGGNYLYDVDLFYQKATSGCNTVRRTGMHLPDGKAVSYAYVDAASSLGSDNAASRVTRVLQGFTQVAAYEYLGSSRVVKVDLPPPDIYSTVHDGSSYGGLDDFNRVVRDTWTKDLATDVEFYDVAVSDDYNSNVTNLVDAIHTNASTGAGLFDYEYTMDALDRLVDAGRGDWNGSSLTNNQEGEVWTLDLVGNWDLFQLDLDGNGTYTGIGEFEDSRTHNKANELTARDIDNDSTDDYTLVHDKVGNLTDDGALYEYKYDPFGRLRQVIDRTSNDVVAEFRHNGLGYRISAVYDTDSDGSLGDETTLHFAYDIEWRIVAEYEGTNSAPVEQSVYHCAGNDGMGFSLPIDAGILRDKDTTNNGTLDERVYYCQNWRGDVVAIVGSAGQQIEQIRYSPYGVPFGLPAGDANGDGAANVTDATQIGIWSSTGYDVRGDLDLDGDVDSGDLAAFNSGPSGESLGRGSPTRSDVENHRTFGGYEWDAYLGSAAMTIYHVRNRVFISDLGRWTRRDPSGYDEGQNLYEYVAARPLRAIDPYGLAQIDADPCGGGCGGNGYGEQQSPGAPQPTTSTPAPNPPTFLPPPGMPTCGTPADYAEIGSLIAEIMKECPGMTINWGSTNVCNSGGGSTVPKGTCTVSITVCTAPQNPNRPNPAANCARQMDTIKHELTHAMQACKTGICTEYWYYIFLHVVWNPFKNAMCREVNAYCKEYPRSCSGGIPTTGGVVNICSKSCASLGNPPGCFARCKAISARCLNTERGTYKPPSRPVDPGWYPWGPIQ